MKTTVKEQLDALLKHADRVRSAGTLSLFAREPDRLDRLCHEVAGVRVDLSKQLVDDQALSQLVAAAQAAGVNNARQAMRAGAHINQTEQRAALHVALRAHEDFPVSSEVSEVLSRMDALCARVIQGVATGARGHAFTDVVNIGIGGSHLGPQLVCEALGNRDSSGPRVHFLANVDGGDCADLFARLAPQTTLFVIASKSFTTSETQLNARSARAWLTSAGIADRELQKHFIAVTARPDRAQAFGIASENIYPMWDWVGGRFSLWSAIGLPVALHLGMNTFRALLSGGAAMDAHFFDAPLEANLPVLMALVSLWNGYHLGAGSYAVVPYDNRLRSLPDYLQQLEMESNGKSVSFDNTPLECDSALVTWGGLGTNAQHAFFQLLHQGTRFIPVDFVVALTHPAGREDHHDALVANCFAQAEALMIGRRFTPEPADNNGIELWRHRESPGNRPSSMISMQALTPSSLGALLALYEHKTFVQSVLWNINAFDQWGVELGKELADSILVELQGAAGGASSRDPSTDALIRAYRKARAG